MKISTQQAIETLERFQNPEPWEPKITDRAYEALQMAISALEKQEQNRWIPVTDRLPEKDCSCRVTEDNGHFKYVIDCYWSNRKKCFEVWSDYNDCYLQLVDVTAWKPVEEPYKAEGGNAAD